MEISERIERHFLGIVDIKVSYKEQMEHNKIFRKVRQNTTNMLRSEARKINVELDL